MLTPRPSVEGSRPDRFRPPHCPRRDCSLHRRQRRQRYACHGSYRRRCDARRRIPRFRCPACGRTFSRQSFACTYYMKRPELLVPIAAGLVAGSAHRQIARSLGCAPSTVTRIAARLGRHSLLLQALALGRLEGTVTETVVFDHFETFVFSKEDRLGIGTAVGQVSWFVYSFDPAPHRRAGRRAARRRAIRHPLPEPVPQAAERSISRVIRLLERLVPSRLRLVTDDHPAYRAPATASRIDHRVYANPVRGEAATAEIARERDREMFAVDLFHKLLRHSQAQHRRQGLAFGRRSNAILERTALMAVWRNFVKGVSERRADPTTPAMRLGLTGRPWNWLEVLARRLFPDRIELPEGWESIYRRRWITPAVGRNTFHALRHAF